jgi:hypothetical protein
MKGMIALSVGLVLAVAFPAAGQTREFRQSVPFQPGGELVFDTDKGSVTLTAWDRPEVAVYARIEAEKGEDADYGRRVVEAARIDIAGGGQRLSIRSNFDNVPEKGGRWNYRQLPHIHYQIQAPRSLSLRLTADRSRVSLYSFTGRFDVHSDRSPLEARDLSGEVRIRMDRGDIRLEALRGSLNLHTDRTNSRIAAVAIEADSHLEISRGKVDLTVPDAQRLSLSARTGRRNTFSSDFPLPARSVGWIEGRINGGGPHLTVDGDRSDGRLRATRSP